MIKRVNTQYRRLIGSAFVDRNAFLGVYNCGCWWRKIWHLALVLLRICLFPFIRGEIMNIFIFRMLLLLILLCLFSFGCKTIHLPTGKGYTELCQTYVGYDSSRLVDSWGPPGRTFDAGKRKVFVYVETKDEYTMNPLAHSALIEYPPKIDPRRSGPGEKTSGVVGQSVPSMDYCITYFEVSPNDMIEKALWKGNCRSLEKNPTP